MCQRFMRLAQSFLSDVRPSNVRGRISQFWRQTAAAALRHQKQAEEAAASTSASATNPEEVIAQRVLTTIFKHSWPTLQQVTCWQQSFQNLLQDPRRLIGCGSIPWRLWSKVIAVMST
ncbi:unnamed protein product [Taenia asiatica]|uniref:Uncharacterized protein n=1 Tax=Taenia asiatica TaxID=60517 RepID=A0A0R3VYB1_TAEAS|nr:unnamed protein product [Taenia asiatica]